MTFHWTNLTQRYPNERQCLASYLTWQAAEVIGMAKPANLINIYDRKLGCGRNMLPLWIKYQHDVLADSDVCGLCLKHNKDRQLVLIYRPAELQKVLDKKPVKKALSRIGYRHNTVEEALAHLQERMQQDDFPHEVGFFLGYPTKDVYGFMGLCKLPVTGSGPWKMYGKPDSSLAVKQRHHNARQRVVDALFSGRNPLELIQAAA